MDFILLYVTRTIYKQNITTEKGISLMSISTIIFLRFLMSFQSKRVVFVISSTSGTQDCYH